MPEPVVLPVPEHLLAVYAVATELPPGEGGELGSLDAHVTVESYPAESAPLPPVGLLRAMGTTSEVADKIARAATITMVQATNDASDYARAQLAWQVRQAAPDETAPEVAEWIARVQEDFAPQRVLFAHDLAVWEP